ncbi:hypothetical protein GCK72_018949 [Caenorhabditis remanei]|nr:hypothetical protein GCK72_018949 [Caenorhabditis remanei]KAF1752394.1 hypothetical protein GCK72_018949 [Caenorhabditis remanei]
MSKKLGGKKPNDNDTLDVEIETDTSTTVQESKIIDVQFKIVDEMIKFLRSETQLHKAIVEKGEEAEEAYDESIEEIIEAMEIVLKRGIRVLKHNHQTIDWNVNLFRYNLKKMLKLYVDVNNQMKVEEKQAAKQDAFIAILEEMDKDVSEFKENLNSVRDLIGTEPATLVRSRTILSTERLANHIEQPYKPIETEVATHVAKVNREMDSLYFQLPAFDHFPSLMKPVQQRGMKVANLMLKNLPVKTVEDFIATLPRKQRD